MPFFDSDTAAAQRITRYERHARVYRALFIVSALALALLNVFNSISGLIFTVAPKLLLALLAAYRFDMLRAAAKYANWKNLIASALLCGAFLYQLVARNLLMCSYPLPHTALVLLFLALAALALPALFGYALCAVGYVASVLSEPAKTFIARMDKLEKVYLLAAFGLLAAATIVLFSLTNVFYGAQFDGQTIRYDVVYTSDSGSIVQENAYLRYCHDENDLRQPLFALFCMPFSLPAFLLSKLLWFVPNAYAILMNLVQVFLICVSALLLVRMMALAGAAKAAALTLFTALYPTLLFALNMEQYVFSVFWLLVFLYLYTEHATGRDALYIAMTGSLITSGVFFPLLTSLRPFKEWVKAVLRCALLFFAVVLVFNRQHLFFQALQQAALFTGLADGRVVTFSEKLLQYVGMLAGCFIAPAAGVDTALFSYPSWQLDAVTSVNLLGLAVLALSVLGFALNAKKPFARICGVWVLLSFLLHGVLGWGAYENGLILYTYYYGWAFFCLIFMGLEKLLARLKNWRFLLYAAAFAALLYWNIPGLVQIVRFGLTCYPA